MFCKVMRTADVLKVGQERANVVHAPITDATVAIEGVRIGECLQMFVAARDDREGLAIAWRTIHGDVRATIDHE